MTVEQHCQQAAQFVAFHEKRTGPWEEDFAQWADSKDLEHRDRMAIYTIAWEIQVAHSRATVTDPMRWFGAA